MGFFRFLNKTKGFLNKTIHKASNFGVLRYNNNEGFRTKINNHIIDSINIILEDDKGRSSRCSKD